MDSREEVFTSLDTSFFYNQTSKSIKCNSHEQWGQNWIDVSDPFHSPDHVPCSTNENAVAYFSWDSYPNRL